MKVKLLVSMAGPTGAHNAGDDLHKHLSRMDLGILDEQWMQGITNVHLTESEVVDLFL